MDERIEISLEDVHEKNIVAVSALDQVKMARHRCSNCGEDDPPYIWFDGNPYHLECYVMEKWVERGWIDDPQTTR